MEIRRIEPDDWKLLRAVRLAALKDTPLAFLTRYDEAAEYPDAVWQQRARAGSAGNKQTTFLLLEGAPVCGMVTGLTGPEDPTEVLLVGMWVAPAYRRLGHGARLVARLIEWADDWGAASVRLGVTAENEAALSLYESCGFALTGQSRALSGHSALVEHTMRLRLSG
jgi:ribosomal protein S18 acetylase RimI-like enzyme